MDFGGFDVEAEEVEEGVVVLQFVDVHEHGSACVSWVRDEDVGFGPAIEFVCEPGVDGAEAEIAIVVAFFDCVDVPHKPEELRAGWVGGERLAAELHQVISALLGFELSN